MSDLMNEYDFCFVMGGFPLKWPNGGEIIIFKLAELLSKDNYKTAILFQPHPNLELYLRERDSELLKVIGVGTILIIAMERVKWMAHAIIAIMQILLLRKYRKIKKSKFDTNQYYNFSSMEKVDILFTKKIVDANISAKYMLVVPWQAAYFSNELKSKCKNLYQLVQNDEVNPLFSGALSKYAKHAYEPTKDIKKIVISEKLRMLFLNEHPTIFHIGFDSEMFKKQAEIKRESNTVLIILRKGNDKGASYAIEAAEHIKRQMPTTKIYAYGNYDGDISNAINFLGAVDNKKLVELYNKNTIFVLPSLLEGMSVAPMQAMACGCTVVVTDCGGVEEYIVNGSNGIIVPVKDSKAIADAVCKILNDDKLMNKLQAEGEATAKKYTYSAMYKGFKIAIGL
jgi:glycosyltransferase involved in cell wall biosynthesis